MKSKISFATYCRTETTIRASKRYQLSIKTWTKQKGPHQRYRCGPSVKASNYIQSCSKAHSLFAQQLDSTAASSLQPLSQHSDEQPVEQAHEPPDLHEHWFASHAQSVHVQSSPQHMHDVAFALLKVARANGIATTALSSASPANDLINIAISLVKK